MSNSCADDDSTRAFVLREELVDFGQVGDWSRERYISSLTSWTRILSSKPSVRSSGCYSSRDPVFHVAARGPQHRGEGVLHRACAVAGCKVRPGGA